MRGLHTGRIVIVRPRHLDFSIGYLLVLRLIGVNVGATLGIEPHVHGAVVHDLDFSEVEVRMAREIVLDDFFEVSVSRSYVLRTPRPCSILRDIRRAWFTSLVVRGDFRTGRSVTE